MGVGECESMQEGAGECWRIQKRAGGYGSVWVCVGVCGWGMEVYRWVREGAGECGRVQETTVKN